MTAFTDVYVDTDVDIRLFANAYKRLFSSHYPGDSLTRSTLSNGVLYPVGFLHAHFSTIEAEVKDAVYRSVYPQKSN